MFQSKKPKSSHGVCHVRKFHLRTAVSRDTQCSRVLNMQLRCIIAERAIRHSVVMDGQSFGQNQ